MTTRDELVVALAGRYAVGSRADRGRMLDEFAALTGHHRKHAMRLLRGGAPDRQVTGEATAPSAPTLAQFLVGLRTSWQEGEVRPTAKPGWKAHVCENVR